MPMQRGPYWQPVVVLFHWAAWVKELDGGCAVLHLPFWPYAELFCEWMDRPAGVTARWGGWVNVVAAGRGVGHQL